MQNEPFRYESYHEWKLRKARRWAAQLTSAERKKIREFITELTLHIAEVKSNKRKKYYE